MTDQDLIIQDLRRENAMLKEQLAQYMSDNKSEQKWRVRYCGGSHIFCDGLCTICTQHTVYHTTTGGVY